MPHFNENKAFNVPNLGNQAQETLTLLQILAIGDSEVAGGKLTSAQDVFQRLISRPRN